MDAQARTNSSLKVELSFIIVVQLLSLISGLIWSFSYMGTPLGWAQPYSHEVGQDVCLNSALWTGMEVIHYHFRPSKMFP